MSSINLDVNTSIEVPVNAVGLVDSSDGITPEESIAYNEGGMDLEWHFISSSGSLTNTAVVPASGGDYQWSHIGNAMYKINIPASGGASINNDTEGYGWFVGQVSGVLPFRSHTFCFRASSLNDALCDGGDVLDVNMSQINESSIAAARLALSAAQIIPGTVDTSLVSSTATSFESDDITEATTGHYNGRVVIFTSGSLLGQAVSITDYVLNGSNGAFTVSTMTESPADNDTFIIV